METTFAGKEKGYSKFRLYTDEYAKDAHRLYESKGLIGELYDNPDDKDEYFDAKDENFMVNVKKECPYGFDVVFDCSGVSAAVTTALCAARPNGTVVLVGVSMDNITIPSIALVMHELKVFGAIGYTYEEFVQCINLMSTRKVDMLKFVDDIVGLDDVQKAFERLTSGDDNAIKILIDPRK